MFALTVSLPPELVDLWKEEANRHTHGVNAAFVREMFMFWVANYYQVKRLPMPPHMLRWLQPEGQEDQAPDVGE